MGRLTRSFIPDPFYPAFAISVMAKPATPRGGVLFAVTNANQKVGPTAAAPPVSDGYVVNDCY